MRTIAGAGASTGATMVGGTLAGKCTSLGASTYEALTSGAGPADIWMYAILLRPDQHGWLLIDNRLLIAEPPSAVFRWLSSQVSIY